MLKRLAKANMVPIYLEDYDNDMKKKNSIT